MTTHTHLFKIVLVTVMFLSVSTGIIPAQEGPAGIPEDSGAAVQIPAPAQLQDHQLAAAPVRSQALSGAPAYDCGWVALAGDASAWLGYERNGSADSFLVNMLQYDGGRANGANQRHLGGADFGAKTTLGAEDELYTFSSSPSWRRAF
jgi:hypothetical protein